jgi:hypothetical protein
MNSTNRRALVRSASSTPSVAWSLLAAAIVGAATGCADNAFVTSADAGPTADDPQPSTVLRGVTHASEVPVGETHPTSQTAHPKGSEASSRDSASSRASSGDASHREDAGHSSVTSADAGKPEVKSDAGSDARSPAARDAGWDAPPSCATKMPSEGDGVFLVSSPIPATGACGLIANPCTDLASAIAALSDTRRTIYVGQGTYTGTGPQQHWLPEIPDNVSIVGGWDVTYSPATGYTFAPTCAVNATFTTDNTPLTLHVGGSTPITGTVTLDSVAVVNGSTPLDPPSAYGIFVSASETGSLVLRNVTVTVPNAASGRAGYPASGVGRAGGTGNCVDPTGNGSPGATGAAGAPSTFGIDGASMPQAGAYGTYGQPGATGTGGTGACTPSDVMTTCVKTENDAGVVDCKVGGLTMACAAAPAPGCGGGAGTPGEGGTGGGSSIGVYMWGGTLVIDGGRVAAGAAGNGGAGGLGSAGGPGGVGETQTSANYFGADGYCMPVVNPFSTDCVPRDMINLTSLAAGTSGTAGGAGGQGGGGAGGDSYAYYLGNNATASLSGEPVLSPSVAGVGGAGGAPNGVAGYSGPTNTRD